MFIKDLASSFLHSLKNLVANIISCNAVANRIRVRLFKFVCVTLLPILLALYGACLLLTVLLLPVTLTLFFFSPGILWSVFTLVPFIAFRISMMISPINTCSLFIMQMKQYDGELADQLEESLTRPKQNVGCCEYVSEFMAKNGRFLFYFTLFFVIGFVPVVGTVIGTMGQIYFISEGLALQLLDIYIRSYKEWNYHRRRKFISENRWTVIGFALPYTLLLSIPLLGTILLGYAQAGAADLCYRKFHKKNQDEDISSDML